MGWLRKWKAIGVYGTVARGRPFGMIRLQSMELDKIVILFKSTEYFYFFLQHGNHAILREKSGSNSHMWEEG